MGFVKAIGWLFLSAMLVLNTISATNTCLPVIAVVPAVAAFVCFVEAIFVVAKELMEAK